MNGKAAAAVNSDVRARWIEAGKRVAAGGESERIPCPENQDGYLEVRWVPFGARRVASTGFTILFVALIPNFSSAHASPFGG